MIALGAAIDQDALRLRHEFVAMPGLRLTGPQTARLLDVRLDHAIGLLQALEEEGFLARTADGLYRLARPLTP